MRSKKKRGSLVTLLLVIAAIIILHALRDLREGDKKKGLDDAVLTWEISRY
ncbi:MAG TPA: hypothetical protein PLL71_07255 [Agriterribacter sp.]|nr:hypothetical protein [Agriterribacter sp.]HRQ51634.1 hypothetical protein [Agriterribacter sp.]